MATQHIQIDLDKLLDVALRGVRRASVFMGLGVNAALDDRFKNFQLSHLTKIQLIPSDVSSQTLRGFKEEFRIWIEANGLRELAETFVTFLDSLHDTCLLVRSTQKKEPFAAAAQRRFKKKGFPEKLSILSTEFAVGPKHGDCLISLNRARNCLTHRNGVVGVEDVESSNELHVKWQGMDVFVKTPSGERHSLTEMPDGGIYLRDGGNVMTQMIERLRAFQLGAKLSLSTRDLAEVCWFYDREARSAIQSAIEYFEKMGVGRTGT